MDDKGEQDNTNNGDKPIEPAPSKPDTNPKLPNGDVSNLLHKLSQPVGNPTEERIWAIQGRTDRFLEREQGLPVIIEKPTTEHDIVIEPDEHN